MAARKLDHKLSLIVERITTTEEGHLMVKRRRQYSAAFKFRDALEALGGRKTVIQFSSELEVHAKLIPAKNPSC